MKSTWNEIKQNIYLVHRLAVYENRIKYADSALGNAWHVINPLIQIAIYWVVFGLGIRGGRDVEGVPFFLWMLTAMIPWFYISASINKGANSVHSYINLISKSKVSISLMPLTSIVTELYNHLTFMILLLGYLLFSGGLGYKELILLPYFTVSLTVLLVALAFVTSTLSTISRDFYQFVLAITRMLFYATPILWVPSKSAPDAFHLILRLNPFNYIVQGYRECLLGINAISVMSWETLYFWGLTAAIALYGAFIHNRFKRFFVDY